jgi:hypothetical protein
MKTQKIRFFLIYINSNKIIDEEEINLDQSNLPNSHAAFSMLHILNHNFENVFPLLLVLLNFPFIFYTLDLNPMLNFSTHYSSQMILFVLNIL